ncbi:MAG: extracellular solute-binding protein [Chloroflexi bacterium]|nr:extracellular solute-binding protein [Chloroflexota bacterium]
MLQKLRNIKLRRQHLLVLIPVILMLVFGVGYLLWTAIEDDDDPAASPAQSTGHTPEPTAVLEQTVVVWHPFPSTSSEAQAFDLIRQQFQDRYPNITLVFEAHPEADLLNDYTTAVQNGAGPQVLLAPGAWVLTLAENGLIDGFSTELFDTASDPDYVMDPAYQDNPVFLAEPIARAFTIDNTPFALAYSTEFATLYFNRTVVGSTPELEYFNDSDFLATMQDYSLFLTPTFTLLSGLYLAPGRSLDTLSTDSVEAFLEDLDAFQDEPLDGIDVNNDVNTYQAYFREDRILGFLLASSADYAGLKSALGDDLGILPLPRHSTAVRWQVLVPMEVAVLNLNNTLQEAGAAEVFVQFLLSADMQRVWFDETGRTPANVLGLESELAQVWGETLEHSVAMPLGFETTTLPQLDYAIRLCSRAKTRRL